MRVVSISVNGLGQAVDKGFFDWLARQDADVVCVQDHRMRAYEIEDFGLTPEGYEGYFIDGENNEDGGVGIYTRHFPKAIMYGFANEQADREGRFIQADFDKVSVACVLAPSALGVEDEVIGENDQTALDHKDDFMEAFGAHMQKTLRKRRQFIVAANLQSAHHVTDASSRYHKLDVSGFLPHERAWLDRLFDEMGCVDAFREINKQSNQYTWWPEWAEGWRRHAGIRTDYQLVTPGIRKTVTDGWIDDSTRFSDHAPIIMDYDIEIGH
ncbi:exodeoxyribonuclease III [Marinobacter caseinilyticus]|uniref:exodeoxyribonuclease III n=1 Tax=Marinobacter caseinilyticus TaxID=2692195 RepID=UPI00140863EF|nr:exodeoxyribonuclease III [Marinobacter caseinilyticus]